MAFFNCGTTFITQDKTVVWHYSGVLRNPLSGAEIVGTNVMFGSQLDEVIVSKRFTPHFPFAGVTTFNNL